jgi:hypothetical protein
LAVFHFVRQQYGFFALYARRERESVSWIDRAAIYLATLGPVAFWHMSLPREFHWFVEGDFFSLGSLSALVGGTVAVAYVAIGAAYIAKEAKRVFAGGGFNLPKNLLLLGTALSWGAGIVLFNSDIAFTVTNVVAHGIPYLALVWIMGRGETAQAVGASRESAFLKWIFSVRAWPMFVGLLLAFAYLEEGLWDALVWREHAGLFPAFQSVANAELDFHLGWVVPLLALPQATHYVLDGFIWRIKAPAAQDVPAVFAEPMERAS